mgnify:CR=1 FL=1
MEIVYRPMIFDEVQANLPEIPRRRISGISAWDDVLLVGRGFLTIWRDVGEISDLWVDDYYRNRGIGTYIIRKLAQIAQKRQIPVIEIGVSDDNHAARRLYERLGFVAYRHLDDIPQPVTYLRCKTKDLLNP